VYISDDPRVFEVDQGIVDKEMTSGRGVKNVEISIFDPDAIEIGRGESSSMKGGGVLAGALVPNTDKVSIFVDTSITDILGSLRLSFLIEEDDGVKVGLSAIVLHPSFTRVVGVLKVAGEWGSKTNRFRRGCGLSDGGLVLSEANRLVTIDAIIAHVWFSEV